MEKQLAGKSVIVTGGTRGIGKAIALDMAAAGANVAISGRNMEAAAEVVKEIEALGAKGLAVAADVAKQEDAEKLIAQTVEAFGQIDALINNAGITRDQLFMRMSLEDWRAVMDTNLDGMFLVTKAVIKPMIKARKGRIVNISSVVGHTGNPGQVNYSSTKAAVVGFTKSLAKEVGARNITVNAVAPGFIDTDMTRELNEAQQKAILDQIPLGRMGDVKEISAAVRFLVSDEAGYITGTTLHVNGGMY